MDSILFVSDEQSLFFLQGLCFLLKILEKKNTVTNTFLLALFDRPYFVRLDLRSTQLHKKVLTSIFGRILRFLFCMWLAP